jgi:hypothetical protein
MAGVTGHKALTQGLFQHLMQGERNMKADVQEAALEAAIAGQEMIRHIIDTTESSLSAEPKDNRNWTFEMRRSVSSDMKTKGTLTTIRVGWVDAQKLYFLIQEHGGVMDDGRIVTPMNALMAGHTEVLKTLTRWGIKTL